MYINKNKIKIDIYICMERERGDDRMVGCTSGSCVSTIASSFASVPWMPTSDYGAAAAVGKRDVRHATPPRQRRTRRRRREEEGREREKKKKKRTETRVAPRDARSAKERTREEGRRRRRERESGGSGVSLLSPRRRVWNTSRRVP